MQAGDQLQVIVAGTAAGKLLATLVGDADEVSFLKHSQTSGATGQREAGAMAAFRETHAKSTIHGDIYASAEKDAEVEKANLLLKTYPATKAILASGTPVCDGAVDRVLASGATEFAPGTPAGDGPGRRLGVTGYLCVPLTDRGRVLGTLTLLATADHPLDERTVPLAEELARRAAASAVNARQYTQQVRLAHDLQAGLLLPDLPELPGATTASFYQPAGEGLEIGGDFYDLFELGGGRWGFMIGDVCGRGAPAATTTGLVRHTSRAVARLVDGPVAVAEAVNAALLDRAPRHGCTFVTLVYGELRRAGGGLSVELVRAGHVRPVLRRADGSAGTLDVPGMFLGVHPRPSLRADRLRLRAGDSLVLVTDGVTEARSRAGDLFGEERLTAALASHGHGAATAGTVLDAVTGALAAFTAGCETNDDDRAALVITAG